MIENSICKITMNEDEIFESFIAKFNHAIRYSGVTPSETKGFTRYYRVKVVTKADDDKESAYKKIYAMFSRLWNDKLKGMTGDICLVFTRSKSVTGSVNLLCDLYVPTKAHQA